MPEYFTLLAHQGAFSTSANACQCNTTAGEHPLQIPDFCRAINNGLKFVNADDGRNGHQTHLGIAVGKYLA